MSRKLVLAVLLAAGCTSTAVPAAAPPPTTVRPRAPLQLSWQELRREATGAELIARVERLAPLPFPLEVSIALPAGATLIRGRLKFTLPANAEGAIHDERLTIGYPRIPAGDLELTADGKTAELGVHGQVPYRFGRPAPLQEVVAPSGPDLKFGGNNFGPSIPIRPEPAAQAP